MNHTPIVPLLGTRFRVPTHEFVVFFIPSSLLSNIYDLDLK